MRLVSLTLGSRQAPSQAVLRDSGRYAWGDAPLRAWWQTEAGTDVLGLIDWDDEVGALVLREVRVSDGIGIRGDGAGMGTPDCPDEVLTLPIGQMLAEVAAASIPATELIPGRSVEYAHAMDYVGPRRRHDWDAEARADVLQVILRAEQEHRSTYKAVMEHFGVSRSTAARVIRSAREDEATKEGRD